MGGSNREVAEAGAATSVESDTVADLQERIDVLSAFTGGIVFELDREGTYLRVWTGEPTLLARPAEELCGRTVADVLGAAAGRRFNDAFRRVIETGEPLAFDYSLDVQAGRRTFSCVIRPHDPRGGGPRTITALVRDVTAAKVLEGKLVQAERLAALGLLAASVGHEIRQPLAYVVSSVDALERELAAAKSPEEARASLANIREGARRIAEIAASLDVLSKRERNNGAIDVGRVVQAALDMCASELSHVELRKQLGPLPLIRGDEGALCQVFANLILNASQALPPAVGAPSVLTLTSGLATDRDFVRISVIDNGSGIPPEDLPRVFDPFFTTKQNEGGTGLGLFITRGIVEAHGGTLDVRSVPGRGTTVDVHLPVASRPQMAKEPPTGVRPVIAPASGSNSSLKPVAVPAAPRRRLSVLVVDDEPRFLESLRLALEDVHDVVTSTDAADALRGLGEDPRRYDVVLCDLAMPDVDGAAFYERMVALGIGDRFVLMSGGAFTPRATEFVGRCACPSISKPFLLERLIVLLDEVTRDRTAS
jgi:signal transduction histidine kinase/ActR/RegA family two-component response regulator